jgi:FkbM family methyltransferase
MTFVNRLPLVFSFLRLLPNFRGKTRVAKFLSRKKDFQDVLIQGKYGCAYCLPNTTENLGFEMAINGIYEDETINFIKDAIASNGLFLDIGANIGAITIPIARLRPDVKVLAVEAAPRMFSYLTNNLQLNSLANVTPVNKAISNEDGKIVNFYTPHVKFGKGSMVKAFASDESKVETITIDSIALANQLKIDFIKIDIEGFESLAFKGGQTLLTAKDAPDILFEFVDWAENILEPNAGKAQELLLTYGYKLFLLEEGELTKPVTSPIISGAFLIFATKGNPNEKDKSF